MSRSRLETRAEIAKLARLLDVEPASLAYLERVDPAALRSLRELATDRLYDADIGGMQRVAAASALIPAAVSATVAQRALGPLLCARVAGALDARRAVDIAKRLPAPFLADVAVQLDPRRASSVIANIPTDHVVAVARELAQRGEHITMGRFVGHLSDATLTAVFEVLSDEDLLHVAFTLEEKDRLDHAVRLLPPARMTGVLRTASEAGMWAEALDLFDHLSPERRIELATIVSELPDEVLESLIETAQAEGLWPDLLPLAAAQPDLLDQLVEPARKLTPEQRSTILAEAERLELTGALGPLKPVLEAA